MSLQIHTDVFSFTSYETELARIKAEMEANIRAEIRQEMESKEESVRQEIRKEILQEILTSLRQMTPSLQKPKANQESVPVEEVHEKMEWNIPDDGMAHCWSFQGKTYAVNAVGGVWSITQDGQPGDWVGMVDLKRRIIDTSVPEPEYED
jgi:hypothetical protein